MVLVVLQGAAPFGLADALKIALERDPQIRTARARVDQRAAELVLQGGAFDILLQAQIAQSRDERALTDLEEMAIPSPEPTTWVTTYRIGASKRFRFGLNVVPSLEVTRTENFEASTRARAFLTLVQPLLRGRGWVSTAAAEESARSTLDAEREDLVQTAAVRALTAILAYWEYAGAEQSLEVLRASEARGASLVKETRTLIESGERPAADLLQLLANQSDKTGARVRGEQALLDARLALGLAIGLGPEETVRLGGATDPLPTGSGAAAPAEMTPTKVMETNAPSARVGTALQNRRDLRAAAAREQAARILIAAAERDEAPRLDLTAAIGYTGLTVGPGVGPLFSAIVEKAAGPSFNVGLTFELPVFNSAQEGLRAQRAAILEQLVLAREDLARSIAVTVGQSESVLGSTETLLASAELSAGYYANAVKNERSKVQAGLSTLIDLILTEDRRTSAELSRINAAVSHASAIARLRFDLGMLVTADDARTVAPEVSKAP